MPIKLQLLGGVAAALLVAALVSFIITPVVKAFAQKVGAVDVPKDGRRMHDHPIARMGGLAIVLGFMLSVILFVDITKPMQGMLLGGVIIVVLGIFDDIYSLPAMFKFVVQIVAALVAVLSGNVISVLSNPNVFSANPYWDLGALAIPITVIWIVALTNAVNLIDGLDGLAVGVSTISSMTLLVIAMAFSEGEVALLMAALAGACIGFMPYNMNPAKIFMGDTGSTFLGFILATVSIQGLFKFPMIISFAVPFLMLGLPIFDTAFAFIRRIAHGQNPMHADRSHVHHRLIDMGFSQKQAVAVLYMISAILGLSAVVLTTGGPLKAMLLLLALCAAGGVSARIFVVNNEKKQNGQAEDETTAQSTQQQDAAQDKKLPEDASEEEPK
ncbi:MAG: MraY family glycosyltransferase [Oscillospiraceae bacterium]